jgi:hypothetical protein
LPSEANLRNLTSSISATLRLRFNLHRNRPSARRRPRRRPPS